jgi:Concanavalin A-like lectin/glucanases superfamily
MSDGRPFHAPRSLTRRQLFRAAALLPVAVRAQTRESKPVGYWPLRGDARDHSGQENHAVNHGVNLETGQFDGRGSYLEVPARPVLDPRTGDFSISSWVYTEPPVLDTLGDVVSKFDPAARRGFTLSLYSTSGGYNGQGSDRHVAFGIDNARTGEWEDCGRPSPTSSYVSNSLTVFDGSLYAATTDGATERDWSHVYRYAGSARWEDCGRVGALKTRGVGPMIVHESSLFAANWSYDWTRVSKEALDTCHVYRYRGGQEWVDCGAPGRCRRLFGLASYNGKLYVLGDDNQCHVWEGGQSWRPCGSFPSLVHPMLVHDGMLHVGAFGGNVGGAFRQAQVYAFDGAKWTSLGCPIQMPEREDQIHALMVYRGKLHATTWPTGKVGAYDNGQWIDCGRLGDSTESNALVVYNGKLYAGTIPGAEVFRFEGEQSWTRLRRFSSPEVAEGAPLKNIRWGRVTSLTVHGGKLFAGIGGYTSALADAPADTRGRVFAFQAGQCVCYDRDLGAGWKHLAALRRGGRLEIYIDGKLQATSQPFAAGDYDLSTTAPLKIGFGEFDYFSGRIREVRLYHRALSANEIAKLALSRARGDFR